MHDICTWIYEFRPGNKTIYVVFDEESEFSGPRTPKLSLDNFFDENVPYKKCFSNLHFLLISFFYICSGGYVSVTSDGMAWRDVQSLTLM